MAVKGTPSWLGDQNAARALRLLLDHGPMSRNALAERSGMSKPTASQMIARLDEKGLVRVTGENSSGRGPNALVYAVRDDIQYGVAINVDQDGVRSRVIDIAGTELPVVDVLSGRLGEGRSAARDVAQAVMAACKAANVDLERVAHVCVGVPSSVDPRADELSSVEALPGWSRKAIRHQIEAALGCDVIIENDVNLAITAERRLGKYAADAIIALLWLSYGTGLAIDIGGALLRGASGGAGEIGHLPADSWPTSPDGRVPDLEELLGASAIDALAAELGESWTFEAGLAGEPIPDPLLQALAPRLAMCVVPVLGVVDPDVVVLGGPIGQGGGARLASLTRNTIRAHTRWDPALAVSRLANDPVLIGASHVVSDRLRHALESLAGASASVGDRSRAIAARLSEIS